MYSIILGITFVLNQYVSSKHHKNNRKSYGNIEVLQVYFRIYNHVITI